MRKITKELLDTMLKQRHSNNAFEKLSNLPSPNSFKDIKKASKRVANAIYSNEKITIVGDYDVDGVVSTAIMVDFFNIIGKEVDYIIPNRFEHGYGLSPKIVDQIDAGLVITVDNGISAIEAANILKDKQIDLIITDHHTVPKVLPSAYAIINPKQDDCTFPFKDLCGAQVAWYFCAAIKEEMNLSVELSSFLDILCLAIIADIMPMRELNYTMVKQGLKKFRVSKRPAIVALNYLMQKSQINSDDIAFMIAPKINSAGRIDCATSALSFLLSKNEFDAFNALEELDKLNNHRKLLQDEIFKKASNEVDDKPVIIVWGDNWHEGVIGIVASQLSNKFKKPAFVFSVNENSAKGSARANGDLNLHSTISQVEELVLGFGGHKNAAGVSIKKENLEIFKERINLIASSAQIPLHKEIPNLGELDVSSVDLEFINIIEQYEPYGLDNIKPTFKISNAQVINSQLFGKDKNHLKISLSSDGFTFEAIKFNRNSLISKNSLNVIVSINKNEFKGEVKPQFLIQEFL